MLYTTFALLVISTHLYAQSPKKKRSKIVCFNGLGERIRFQWTVISVEVYLSKVRVICEEEKGNRQLANVLHKLSLNYIELGKFDESLTNDFKALAIREAMKDEDGFMAMYTENAIRMPDNEPIIEGKAAVQIHEAKTMAGGKVIIVAKRKNEILC